MKRLWLLSMIACAALALGCGSKKAEVKDGASVGGDTDSAGTDGVAANGMEPEAETGPVEYPAPPSRSSSSRNPVKFDVSLQKAYVLPLSDDGACFDPCTKEVKSALVDALPGLAGDQFGSAAKALTTSIGAKGGKESLPDLYVHIDCGFGQELDTNKTGAENRLAANWRGAGATLKLDPDDECAISVWDADDDGQDELIGDTVAKIVRLSKDGNVVVSSESADFGQVFMVELFLDQLEGTPVTGTPSNNSGSSSGNSGSSSGNSGSSSGNSGSTTPSVPDSSGNANYYVEVVKAKIKDTKSDGQKWDTKLPFVGKAGDESPDPFVHAYVNGYKSETPFLKTDAGNNVNYKEWNKGASVKMNVADKIHFMVWDKDTADHDLIGECISNPVGLLQSGSEITISNCGQVEFLVFKITRK